MCVLVLWSQCGRWLCVEGVLARAAALIAPLSILLTLTPTHTHTHKGAPEKVYRDHLMEPDTDPLHYSRAWPKNGYMTTLISSKFWTRRSAGVDHSPSLWALLWFCTRPRQPGYILSYWENTVRPVTSSSNYEGNSATMSRVSAGIRNEAFSLLSPAPTPLCLRLPSLSSLPFTSSLRKNFKAALKSVG